MIAALGRHCTRLRTLWLESYAPAPALDGAPDLGELAALASLESLQLTFAAPRRYAAPPVGLPYISRHAGSSTQHSGARCDSMSKQALRGSNMLS